jgi:hypothetical protein
MCLSPKTPAIAPPALPPPPPPPPQLPDNGVQQAGADYRKRVKAMGSGFGTIVNDGGAAGLATPAATTASKIKTGA